MAIEVISNALVLAGAYNLSGVANAVTVTDGADIKDATVLSSSGRVRAAGFRSATARVEGYREATADTGLAAGLALTDVPFSVAHANTENAIAYTFKALWADMVPLGGAVGEMARMSLTAESSSGAVVRVTTGPITDVTVDKEGATFTRVSGSFITDGFRVGHTVTWVGFTESENLTAVVITALTATVMTASAATLKDEDAGDTVTATMTPLVGATYRPLIRGILGTHQTAAATSSASTKFQLGAVTAAQYLYGALHVYSASGTNPTLDVTLQSDADASAGSETVRLTFAQKTAAGYEWASPIVGAITDTYWRASWTVAGTNPLFAFAVVFGIL
jgi:hypothetical protein